MGIFSNIKNIFKKDESNKDNKIENTIPTYENRMSDYNRIMKESKEEAKRIDKQIMDDANYMEARLNALDNASGARHFNEIARKEAEKFADKYKVDARGLKRKEYLEDNPEQRLDNLIKKLKSDETMKKLGLKSQYSGDYTSVLDQYNYDNLSDKVLDTDKRVVFIPYLCDLEKTGGFYQEKELPEKIKDLYDKFKKLPEKLRKYGYLKGFAMGIQMGIYDLDNYKDYFDKEEQEFLKEESENKLDNKLPKEFEKYVTKKENDKSIQR